MKTLIIDDERLARRELISQLAAHTQIQIIGEAANPEEAIRMVRELEPDLLFLDIQMPGMNGFEMLQQLERVPRVIFVTAFDEYALRAFEVNALDYLLKPVEEDRLAEALLRLGQDQKEEEDDEEAGFSIPPSHLLGQDDQIFLRDGERCWFVHLRDVRLFESEGNYVRVYFDKYKPLILKSLNNLEDRLDRTFFRTNRKFIVNLRWVSNVENWFNGGLRLTLKDGTQVEVSRRQSARFRELMSL
ncbi:MAG: LytR/AlgR family response regulator transcription factor [Flavobacteriales bacterium]|jgi:two-component system LytT family response regulator